MVRGTGGTLDPLGNTTCEQALAMFYRAYICLSGDSLSTLTSPQEKYPNLSPWAKEEIEAMDELALIPERFLGRDMVLPITRGEMCYVAMEAYLSLHPNPIFRVEDSPFTDMDDPTITQAYYLGFVNGFPNGTFCPDAPITREQMALILYRYAGSPDASGMVLREFADGDSVSAYAVDAIRWAVHEGLISGMENNTLAPQGTATRAQVAQILMNFHQKLDK